MVVRISNFGGTNFTTGEILKSSDLNNTFAFLDDKLGSGVKIVPNQGGGQLGVYYQDIDIATATFTTADLIHIDFDGRNIGAQSFNNRVDIQTGNGTAVCATFVAGVSKQFGGHHLVGQDPISTTAVISSTDGVASGSVEYGEATVTTLSGNENWITNGFKIRFQTWFDNDDAGTAGIRWVAKKVRGSP